MNEKAKPETAKPVPVAVKTGSTPAAGESLGAPVGGAGMPRGFAELSGGLGAALGGGAAAVAAPARGFSELTKRVFQRWGALPLKGLQVYLGTALPVAAEDAQLLGECTVDAIKHSAVDVDPAAEARYRLAGAYAAVLAETWMARLEARLKQQREAAAAEEKR